MKVMRTWRPNEVDRVIPKPLLAHCAHAVWVRCNYGSQRVGDEIRHWSERGGPGVFRSGFRRGYPEVLKHGCQQ